jgi:hypothetical protein
MTQKRRLYGLFRRRNSPRKAPPRKLLVTHGGRSRALVRARFDMRSAVGKAYRQSVEELVHHLGGPEEVSAVERRLVDNASRLHVLKLLALDAMNRTGAFKDGAPTPAHEAYRRALADESSMVRSLGLKPRAKRVSLGEVLSAEEDDEPPD